MIRAGTKGRYPKRADTMFRAGTRERYPKRGLKSDNNEDSTNESLILRAPATAEKTDARKRAKKEEKKGVIDDTERYGFECVLGHVICMKTGQVLFKVRRSFHAIVGILKGVVRRLTGTVAKMARSTTTPLS